MKQATSQAVSDGFENVVSALTSYSWGRGDRGVALQRPGASCSSHQHMDRASRATGTAQPPVPGYRDTAQPC